MPSVSRLDASDLQILICRKASEVPAFVYEALHRDEIHSNVVLPTLLKCQDREQRGNVTPGQLWIICHIYRGNVPELRLIASCTDGMMGKYPAFLWSPASPDVLLKQPWTYKAVELVARALFENAGLRRIYSVFGPDVLSRTFVNIWKKNTGIQHVQMPYYDSYISYCTLKSFINKSLPLPPNEYCELRLAGPADREGVAKLCYIFAKDSPPFVIERPQAYYEADKLIRERLVFVHTLGNDPRNQRIVSLVAFTRNTDKTATITKVVTDPEARGRKCAERLTRFACHSLFTVGGKEQIALFVGVDNSAAKVYQRVGFVGIGENATPVEGVDRWVEYGFDPTQVDLGLW